MSYVFASYANYFLLSRPLAYFSYPKQKSSLITRKISIHCSKKSFFRFFFQRLTFKHNQQPPWYCLWTGVNCVVGKKSEFRPETGVHQSTNKLTNSSNGGSPSSSSKQPQLRCSINVRHQNQKQHQFKSLPTIILKLFVRSVKNKVSFIGGDLTFDGQVKDSYRKYNQNQC